MKIAIIEDEALTADDLAETILIVEPKAEIIALLRSVREATDWFRKNDQPDLIFSDIQLGDGLSFSALKSGGVSAPVIFCTAYDEYALSAFKANGIDYVLKPFTKKTISEALDRYHSLKNAFAGKSSGYENISKLFEQRLQPDQSVLVYFKEKILPIKITDIAYFYLDHNITHLVALNRDIHCITRSLEELEKITSPVFYRVNRKYLVNRNAIKDVSQYFNRKLLVNLIIPSGCSEPVTVSKEKVAHFLNWLSGA